jgi:hypothetical protein
LEELDWKNATATNTFDSYHKFFSDYPATKYKTDLNSKFKTILKNWAQTEQPSFESVKPGQSVTTFNNNEFCPIIAQLSSSNQTYYQKKEMMRVLKRDSPGITIQTANGNMSFKITHNPVNPIKLGCKESPGGRYDLVYSSGSGLINVADSKNRKTYALGLDE